MSPFLKHLTKGGTIKYVKNGFVRGLQSFRATDVASFWAFMCSFAQRIGEKNRHFH